MDEEGRKDEELNMFRYVSKQQHGTYTHKMKNERKGNIKQKLITKEYTIRN